MAQIWLTERSSPNEWLINLSTQFNNFMRPSKFRVNIMLHQAQWDKSLMLGFLTYCWLPIYRSSKQSSLLMEPRFWSWIWGSCISEETGHLHNPRLELPMIGLIILIILIWPYSNQWAVPFSSVGILLNIFWERKTNSIYYIEENYFFLTMEAILWRWGAWHCHHEVTNL